MNTVIKSPIGCASWMPVIPKKWERMSTNGIRVRPCLADAKIEALAALPADWSIIFDITIQELNGNVIAWKISAGAPTAITSASSRNRWINCGAKIIITIDVTTKNANEYFTQNQNASFTLL